MHGRKGFHACNLSQNWRNYSMSKVSGELKFLTNYLSLFI